MLLAMEPKVYWLLVEAYPRLKYASKYNINANINVPGATQLNIMPPDMLIRHLYTEQFDLDYISYLLGEDTPFFSFMYPVIDLINGNDVILFIYNEQSVFAPINEVILKLIQQRYGYNYQILENIFDYDQDQFSGATAPGVIQFDQDMKRWQEIMMKVNPNFFVKEVIAGYE